MSQPAAKATRSRLPDRPYTRLAMIARNAESWHHDAEAKQRALNVIAAWARGDELPQVLVDDLLKERGDA